MRLPEYQDWMFPWSINMLMLLLLVLFGWHCSNNNVRSTCLNNHYPAHLCKQLP